jgi:anti-anti-sigma factor
MRDTKPVPDAWSAAPTIEIRRPRRDVAQVVLGGEHDLSTQDQLNSTLATALANCSHLIVDLSTTQLIDSSTIGVLIAIKKRAEANDRRFNLLLGTEPIVERILEITGVLPLLNRVHALEEAISNRTSTWPTRASAYL